MLGGLDHSRISRESAAVDESLERLQNVVGDITPDGLVEAFHSRRTRIESVRAECDLVQRDHDKLATQRRELQSQLENFKDKAVTVGADGLVDVDAMAAQKKANGRAEDMFDVPLHKAESRMRITNMSLGKVEGEISAASTAMYNLTAFLHTFEKNLGALLGKEAVLSTMAAAVAAEAEAANAGAGAGGRKGADGGAARGGKFGGGGGGRSGGTVGAGGSDAPAAGSNARGSVGGARGAGGARGTAAAAAAAAAAADSAVKAENSASRGGGGGGGGGAGEGGETTAAATADGDGRPPRPSIDMNKQAREHVRDLSNFFTMLERANIISAADAHMVRRSGGEGVGRGGWCVHYVWSIGPLIGPLRLVH